MFVVNTTLLREAVFIRLFGEGIDKTIHYVVQDDDGNWGRVETLKLVNETKKYELDVKQLSMDKDHMVSFVFPQNDDAFAVTLQSLIHFGLKFKVITPEKLAEILTVIIEQNKEA